MRAMESEQGRAASVLEAGTRDLIVAYPDEFLRDAVARMLAHDIGRLPVVDRHDRRRLLGYLGRAGIMRARVRLFQEENPARAGGRVLESVAKLASPGASSRSLLQSSRGPVRASRALYEIS